MEKLLEVKNLCVSDLINGDKIIKDVSFYVKPNTSVAIVGESGSGKSMTVRSVMGINKPWLYSTGSIIDGSPSSRPPRYRPPPPLCRSEERRVGKECRSRWSPYH